MELQKAKEIACKAGLQLAKEGLVARTWGNISVKVDDETMVITPSGRTYEELTPDDIVEVKIADSSWEGPIKPSSEKGLHAAVYMLRSDINAVIHTHQKYASVVASARKEIPTMSDEMQKAIGDTVACAAYGLPSTGKLKKGTVDALARSRSKAAVLANHGAVCIGTDMDDAFKVAKLLEKVSKAFIEEEFKTLSGSKTATEAEMHQYYLDNMCGRKK